MKIFLYCLNDYDELPYVEPFSQKYEISYAYTDAYPTLDNLELAKGYDAISILPCDMSLPYLQKLHEYGIRYILCRSVGYDHINLAEAKELGIRVSTVSYPPEAVADYTIMMMLMCLRKIPYVQKRFAMHDYGLKGKLGRDISQQTIGIIGTGRIGTTVIKHLSGFGCRILAYDLYPNEEVKPYATYVDLSTLLQESDVVSLHINATNENEHLISKEALKMMKKDAILINTARGKLVDEVALEEALVNHQIGGAGLDVIEDENNLYYYDHSNNPSFFHPFLERLSQMDQVLLLPHLAFYTDVTTYNKVKQTFESANAIQQNLPNPYEQTI